jgi:hypothetical protein
MKVDLNEITTTVFKQQTINICLKFREAFNIFTDKENEIEKLEEISTRVDALLFKFTLAVINLEFLWRISEYKNKDILDIKLDEQFEWNNSISIIDSTFFESTIIQISAFIDFAQRLSCLLIGNDSRVFNSKDFYKKLKESDHSKSNIIKDKFKEIDKSWGKEINTIRNQIVHYDIIKTNHAFRPTLNDKKYEEFAQAKTNDMFCFLIDLCEILFDIKWISGTFEEFKMVYSR